MLLNRLVIYLIALVAMVNLTIAKPSPADSLSGRHKIIAVDSLDITDSLVGVQTVIESPVTQVVTDNLITASDYETPGWLIFLCALIIFVIFVCSMAWLAT